LVKYSKAKPIAI